MMAGATAMRMEGAAPQVSWARYALGAFGVSLAPALAALAFSPSAALGALTGAAAASAGTVVALLALARSAGAQGALVAMSAGMGTRMMLLAAAVLASRTLGGAVLWWCLGSFFVGFVASMAAEYRYTVRQQAAAREGGK